MSQDDTPFVSGDDPHSHTEPDRVEYWEGILQDHPVSEEYKKAHVKATLINWTSEGLIRAERYIEAVVEKAREALNEARRYDDEHTRSVVELFSELHKIAESDTKSKETDELRDMMRSNEVTISQFVDWYRRHHLHNVETYLEEAHTYAGILNDVRTGHAGTSFMEAAQSMSSNGVINSTPAAAQPTS